MEIILVAADAGLVTRKAWDTHALYCCQVEQCRAEKRQWSVLAGRVADSSVSNRASATAFVMEDMEPRNSWLDNACMPRTSVPWDCQWTHVLGLQHKPHW